MRQNKLKKLLKSNNTVACGWLHIPNSWSAEVMANAGWDCVAVDMQHGLQSIETAIQMMQGISTTETVPLARANWNSPGEIMRLLDGGAYGIICPMINNKEECESFVGACKYPPLGYRSFGPTRARVYAGMDYGDYANDEILTFAMVETVQALENINEICSVEGLYGIFIGSGDLKLSIKATTKNDTTGFFDQAIDTVLKECQQRNLVAGIWCATIEDAKKMIEKGFKFIALKSDSMMLTEYAKEQTVALKNIFTN
ncbi:HpcH/HpaI aldolase family protein [Gillisia sp. Q332]|uniref:HpcH/HpaI aldolase family protein n=1 Tax=Gillisia xinjiangensis TaxID=3384765 RepID=UPI00391CE3C9